MKPKDQVIIITIGMLVLLAFIFISYPLLIKRPGVIIVSIGENSSCSEVLIPGSIITEIEDKTIQDPEDFYKIVDDLNGRVSLIVDERPRICTITDWGVDVEVKERETQGIRLGVDIKGGKELIVESSNPEEDLGIIKSRENIIGLETFQTSIIDSGISLVFDPVEETEVRKILEPGIVSSKILKAVEIENKTGEFLLNEQSYDVTVNNQTLEIRGTKYKTGDEFTLDGIEISVQNVTENFTSFFLNVFDDRDLDVSDSQNKRAFQSGNQYVFVIDALLSQEASKIFAKLTRGQPSVINPQGENYLQDPLVVFVDEEIITSFPVSSSEAGTEIELINIWGVENSRQEASRKLKTLDTYLSSGRLMDIEIIEEKETKPENEGLIDLTIYFTLGLITLFSLYVLIRSKDIKKMALTIGILLVEIIFFLGIISSQVFSMILLITCLVFVFMRSHVNKWYRYFSVFLAIVIWFGAVANKLIVDTYTLIGFMVGFFMGLLQIMFLKKETIRSSKKYKKLYENFWKMAFIIFSGLTIIFFMQDYKNLAIASTIMLFMSLVLTKPEYTRLLKKFK
jgi:hypothetical protein